MPNHKLILTGFTGTGKTTLARLIAHKTSLPFVDISELITERTGLTIPDIIDQMGEAGFRAWEAAMCAEIGADQRALVVSTGGSTLLNPDNLQALQQRSTIVCLSARPSIIYERIQSRSSQLPVAQIEQLLVEHNYARFCYQVDTSDQHPQALADHIIDLWEQNRSARANEQRILTPEGSYPMIIERGALGRLRELLDVYCLTGSRIIIGADTHVASLYGRQLVEQMPNAALVSMPIGETHKHLATINHFYDEFVRLGLGRDGIVLALGGGVVGDTVGYAAATYMRGVRLVQVPTTLLAMIDSAIGGKVGVDTLMGKNLVGAFKQPDLIVADPDVLDTLPAEDFNAGIAEVIKYGLVADPTLLDRDMSLEDRIRAAVRVKIDIVQRDPYEQGERMFLNFGYTFAHAIERVSGYSWRHGDAVAVGLVGEARLSARLGLLDSPIADRVEQLVQDAGLPTRYRHLSSASLWNAMRTDKKWRDGRSHFVILHALGKPAVVRDVPRDLVIEVLDSLRDAL